MGGSCPPRPPPGFPPMHWSTNFVCVCVCIFSLIWAKTIMFPKPFWQILLAICYMFLKCKLGFPQSWSLFCSMWSSCLGCYEDGLKGLWWNSWSVQSVFIMLFPLLLTERIWARWKKEMVLSFSFRLFQIAYFPFNFLGTPELLLLTCLCQETRPFSAFIY